MPASVRAGIDEIAGSPVVDATNCDGGFSPGPAARCTLEDGSVVFVKAVGSELNPVSPEMHRREARVLAGLDDDVPAPQLIGVFDDGDWVALVIEWIDGRMPVAPLDRDEVDRLLRLLERLSAAVATGDLLPCADTHPGLFGHWKRLVDRSIEGLDPWSTRHLDRLVELESGATDAVEGDHLVHGDVRSDNVIFSSTGPDHDVVVDWPGASRGAPWVDVVALLPALELDGGPPAQAVFHGHPTARAADPDMVDAFVATMAGYFTRMSLLPAPPGLPTLRSFQAVQGRIARRWVAERRGWDTDGLTA